MYDRVYYFFFKSIYCDQTGIGQEFARLPDTWYCEYNIWDLPKASCDAPEDVLE